MVAIHHFRNVTFPLNDEAITSLCQTVFDPESGDGGRNVCSVSLVCDPQSVVGGTGSLGGSRVSTRHINRAAQTANFKAAKGTSEHAKLTIELVTAIPRVGTVLAESMLAEHRFQQMPQSGDAASASRYRPHGDNHRCRRRYCRHDPAGGRPAAHDADPAHREPAAARLLPSAS